MQHTEIEMDGKVYRRINEKWYDTSAFILVPHSIARRLEVRLLRAEEAATMPDPQPKEKPKKKKRKSKEPGFQQEDVLPLIADLIRAHSGQNGDYVTHHEIVDALLANPQGKELAEAAVEKRGHSVRRWAGWMVQSFSQNMSSDDSEYADDFERDRIDGAWAYRPAG